MTPVKSVEILIEYEDGEKYSTTLPLEKALLWLEKVYLDEHKEEDYYSLPEDDPSPARYGL